MGYHRINLDGESRTETRVTAGALVPGTAVYLSGGQWVQAPSGAMGRFYIMHPADHQGLTVGDSVPSGDSGVGEYAGDGREMAVLAPAGVYTKDQPLTIGSSGKFAAGAANIVAYCQDDVTLAADDLIRVRFSASPTTATATAVSVDGPSTVVKSTGPHQFVATVDPAAADQTVAWSITTNASGGTVDASTGVYTAGGSAGTDKIKATHADGPSKTVDVIVTNS